VAHRDLMAAANVALRDFGERTPVEPVGIGLA
jgi:hypothetical protein